MTNITDEEKKREKTNWEMTWLGGKIILLFDTLENPNMANLIVLRQQSFNLKIEEYNKNFLVSPTIIGDSVILAQRLFLFDTQYVMKRKF